MVRPLVYPFKYHCWDLPSGSSTGTADINLSHKTFVPMKRIYLDNNATTPLDPRVLEEMLPYLSDRFGNPSSIHSFGREARKAVDQARSAVAELIGAEPSEIVFTSGGTEANNQAIRGVTKLDQTAERQIVTSAVEHPAVLNTCYALRDTGVNVFAAPVNSEGLVDVEAIKDSTGETTALLSIMLANNDVGTVMPVGELSEITRESNCLLHTDAVQAAGKVTIDVRALGVDLLSLSSHKVYGPKGCGALYVRKGTKLAPLMFGGEHESGYRAGTENVAGIVGFGKACALALDELEQRSHLTSILRDRLEKGIIEAISGVKINGHPSLRLPNTLNVSFHSVEAELLLMNLDMLGIAVSAGSACSSGAVEPSHVLTAMGLNSEESAGALRFSLGIHNTENEVDRTIEVLVDLVKRLRGASPPSGLPV